MNLFRGGLRGELAFGPCETIPVLPSVKAAQNVKFLILK